MKSRTKQKLPHISVLRNESLHRSGKRASQGIRAFAKRIFPERKKHPMYKCMAKTIFLDNETNKVVTDKATS